MMEQLQGQGSDAEKCITSAMLTFLNQHIQSSHLNSTLDEIVLNYVVTVLESLAAESGNLEDLFDLTEFCEMLTAYFPEFEKIEQQIVSQWIFDLVASLKELAEKDKPKKEPFLFESLLSDADPDRERLATSSERSKRNSESSNESNYSSYGSFSGSSSSSNSVRSSTSRSPRSSETSDFESEAELNTVISKLQLTETQMDEYCETLVEMFPDLTITGAQNALVTSNGDLEKAVQQILSQMENAASGNSTSKNIGIPSSSKKSVNLVRVRSGQGYTLVKEDEVDEKVLKDRIFARYGFIDKAEDNKEFRPPPLKTEPKKLVRYRESQVVSTKGERYSEVRCKDGGEIKPYLHKPNKQYN